jgi:hypothetical protein
MSSLSVSSFYYFNRQPLMSYNFSALFKALTDAAVTKDILDFIVSDPIRVSVKTAPVAQAPSPTTPGAAGLAPSAPAALPSK